MGAYDDILSSGDVPGAEEIARELAAWVYSDLRAAYADDLADPGNAHPIHQALTRADYLRAACDLAETAGPFAPGDLPDWISTLQKPGFIEQIPLN